MSGHRCKHCGRSAPEVEFRPHSHTGKPLGVCRLCEAAREKGRRAGVLDPRPSTPTDILAKHRAEREAKKLKAERKHLIAELEKAHARAGVISDLAEPKTPIIRRRERASGEREATAVVLASDWHVEEPVEREAVNGLNEYSLGIAEERIGKLTDGILWLLDMHQTRFHIRDLVLWLGGDLMSGYIHDELVESNELSPVETLVWLQRHIIGMIEALLQEAAIEQLVVPCSFGNHGRTTQKKRIATGAENSFEWLLYQQLAHLFESDPRVEILAPRSQLLYLPVYDQTIRFTHGDTVRYHGGVGGPTVPINKAIAGWDIGRHADVTCMGHWHQYFSTPRCAINGSLIGYGPFSVSIKAPFEPPRQSFFLMDSRHGKCCSTPIWVAGEER